MPLATSLAGDPGPQWLGTVEAAEYLGIVPRTLYRFINDGEIPAYKFGRVFRLKRSDVDAFIERNKIAPGALDHLFAESASADADARSDLGLDEMGGR
jgi:excisionase family DNA binding protein